MGKKETVFRKLVKWITVCITMGLILLVISQVFFRYVLHVSVPWTEEIARVLMIWMVLWGTALVQADGAQIRTDFLVSRIPKRFQRMLQIVIDLACIIFLLVIFKGALSMVSYTKGIILGSITWLSTAVLYVPVLLALPIVIIYLAKDIFYQAKE